MRSALLLSVALFAACGEPPRPRVAPVLDSVGGRAEHWIAWLGRYLAVDTTNPPGHEADAIPLLTEALTELGLTVTSTVWGDRRANLWAKLESPRADKKGAIILLHHIDVVPVEREHWTADPFGGATKDGRIYGRGAQDMKAFAALQLAALERLVKQRDRLDRDVIFLAVADEEVDGQGAQRFIRNELEKFGAEYLLDEGGFALENFVEGHDVVVIATAQKRAAKIKVIAEGEAGHGSRPIPGGGPTVLMHALERITSSPSEMRLRPYNVPLFNALGKITPFPRSALLSRIEWPGVLGMLSGKLSADKNVNPVLRDTWAVTVLRAGDKPNVIPSEASAILDVRLLPDTPLETALADLARVVEGLPVRFEVLHQPDPPIEMSPTAGDPLYEALEAAIVSHHPDATVVPWLMVGANDSRFFRPRGVKTYGFGPVFVTKPELDGIHGHDESVRVDAVRRGMTVYADALERFLLTLR